MIFTGSTMNVARDDKGADESAHAATIAVARKAGFLSPFCHPCHPLNRVQTPCLSAFCHPVTLKEENSYIYND